MLMARHRESEAFLVNLSILKVMLKKEVDIPNLTYKSAMLAYERTDPSCECFVQRLFAKDELSRIERSAEPVLPGNFQMEEIVRSGRKFEKTWMYKFQQFQKAGNVDAVWEWSESMTRRYIDDSISKGGYLLLETDPKWDEFESDPYEFMSYRKWLTEHERYMRRFDESWLYEQKFAFISNKLSDNRLALLRGIGAWREWEDNMDN